MASSILESSEGKIYGFKLMRLIVDGGTEALRNVFLNIHPGNLQHVLASNHSTLFPLYRTKKIITQPQWDKLYPHPPRIPNIQEFDITLLVVLLRNICGLSAPSTGWNAMPSASDKSREANIARIKFFRNNFFGHVPGTDVGRLDFEARWVEVSSTLLGLGLSQLEIDRLKEEECGEEEVNRVREKWNQSEREIVSKLDGFEKILEEYLSLSHDLSKQAKSHSDDILSEVLHWCEFENEIQLLLERYTKGTREWIFEQVLTWLNNKSSTNRAFIISGQAGMGKSTIAAVICKLFPENFAACHFFQHNNSRYNNSMFLLQSLAWQLSKVFSEYKKELNANLAGCWGQIINDMNIEGLFSLLFKEPFARCTFDQGTPVLIVIDALDESRQEDRYELVDLITKHFHELPSFIRFLITTRSEKDIMRKFQTLNPIFLEPDEERNLNDLRIFFEKKLQIEAEFVLKRELVEKLIRKSEGLMLYASFVAKLSEDDFFVLDNESLLGGVEEIYESYFKRLENELKILSIDEDKFLSLLSVMVVAKQPLPLPFIEKLLCPEKNSSSARRMSLQLINCVSSLFIVKDECISIFHKSVRDWLVKPGHYFTIIETDGHKTLADICVNQMQTLKQNEVRFTYDLAIDYALRYAIIHISDAKIKDEHALAKLIDNVIDLEIVHSSVCVDVHTTLRNFVNLTSSWNMYDSLCEETWATIKVVIRILRKFTHIVQDTPQSFLQHVANEKIEKLSTKASALLMTRYKGLAYFESDDKEENVLLGRILTKQEVVEVDISPSEDFVICGYKEKGIELFSLSDFKSLWKIDDFVVKRYKNFGFLKRASYITPRRIVFHPFLNVIFPGQLYPVFNFEGKYDSGPITCENVPVKFKCCCFSHDHTKMVTNHDDDLIVWNLQNNVKVRTLECNPHIFSIMFSGNDRYIATTSIWSLNVYDSENNYSMIYRSSGKTVEGLVSTFELDSWYIWRISAKYCNIVKHDLSTKKSFDIDFMFWPRNERATIEFQAMMENKTPMWLQELGSGGNFFMLGNGSVLFFKRNERELRIFNGNELIKGSEFKQEYDECLAGASFHREESASISVDGRYIYTSSPFISLNNTMFSSTRPGKSWKLVPVEYSITPLFPVTNGVFFMKRVRDHVEFDGRTPALWNAELTERLFKFPQLAGTFRCLAVTDNLVACVMKSKVNFFDVCDKKIVASTDLPQCNSSDLSKYQRTVSVIACGSQYHVVYTNDNNTLLLQTTNVVDLSERVLNNLKSTKKYIATACFSPGGGLLAFPSDNGRLIHILDVLTYKILCIPLRNNEACELQFFDEQYLLCRGMKDYLFLVNTKTCDVVTSISAGIDYEWRFSVCRKTGDIVIFNRECKKLKLFKLWLPHQREDENELQKGCTCLLTHA